jgi:hypothetical protein
MKRRKEFNFLFYFTLITKLISLSGCDRNVSTEAPALEAPVIISQSVTDIYSTGATLKAVIKANDLLTTVTFDFGTSISYGSAASGVKDPIADVKADIASLTLGTTYHFRVKAVNSVGTTYGNDMIFTTKFGLGEAYQGGYIIYLEENGEHGLIASDIDLSAGIIWDNGTNCLKTNVTAIAVGSGQPNTARIVTNLGLGNYPAKICNDLVLNGFSDWFLPSLEELDCIWKNLSFLRGDYNLKGEFYWTSSEVSGQNCYAWVQNVNTGEKRTWIKDDNTPYVRAVRAF